MHLIPKTRYAGLLVDFFIINWYDNNFYNASQYMHQITNYFTSYHS